MKQGSSQQRRGRFRGNGGKRNHSSNRSHSLESNGPDGKVRGNAQQILDKYQSLARDASTSGEHIAAEGFYQYAEHYQRLLNIEAANNPNQNQNQNRGQDQRDDNKASGSNSGDSLESGGAVQAAESEKSEPVEASSETVKKVEAVAEADTEDTKSESGDADAETELAASAQA